VDQHSGNTTLQTPRSTADDTVKDNGGGS